MSPPLHPGLYIVATPIGNLSDVTVRAVETLKGVSLVLAEDKRVTAKLLRHVGASVPMMAYHDHSSDSDRDKVLARLATEAVALVSDAGTPLISDPGYKLVRAARAAGLAVHTVPGPCAAIAALTLAGLPTDRFLFAGFLPAKAKARAEAIDELAAIRGSLVLYESGPRLSDTLAALSERLGARDAAVAREITKLHEECVTGPLGELAERYRAAAPKGEIVIVVGPPPEPEAASDDALDSALKTAMASESASRAAALVAEQLGVPRKRAYARALELGSKR
jgi:16S rRNA (cytidine1402-2'-O)-methyltransferase